MALQPLPEPAEDTPAPEGRVVTSKVFVSGLRLEAEIGVYAHERGRTQPLVVDVELDVAMAGAEHLADTVNYEAVAAAGRRLAQSGHVGLVEAFAERLARDCLALDVRATRARVRVEKPMALAPQAAGAGVEIVLVRG